MIRRSNTGSGAYLLRRAATLAHGIEAKYGKRTEVHNGYMVEGRRVAGRHVATVIEPPGTLMLVGPYDGMALATVSAPLREFFSPAYPLQDPTGSAFGERVPFSGLLYPIGPPIPPGATTLAVGHGHVAPRAVYYPSVMYTGVLTQPGVVTAQTWIRVLVAGVGAHAPKTSFSIHESIVRAAAPDYDLIPRTANDTFSWGSLPIPAVCEVGPLVAVAVQVFRGREGSVGTPVITQGLVVIAVDPATGTVAWTSFLSAEAMPAGFVPALVPTVGGTTWAQSAYYHLTAAARGSGVQVVGFYQVEREDTTGVGDPAIVVVMAVADATLTASGASVEMLHADVRAPASSPIVAELGAEPEYLIRALLPHVVGNTIVVEGYRFKRPATWGWAPGGPDFYLEEPYAYLFFGPTTVTTGLALGSIEARQPSVAGSIGFVGDPNQFVAEVAEGTLAYKGRTLTERGVGVTFVKETAARFEPLVEEWSGTFMGELLSVTCPQQELRAPDGTLRVPATLVVLFTRGAADDAFVGVRKGPIWPEDGAGAPEQYWQFYPIATWAQLGAVYTGNPLVVTDHGHMFEAP